jgi:hypothetical protein
MVYGQDEGTASLKESVTLEFQVGCHHVGKPRFERSVLPKV